MKQVIIILGLILVLMGAVSAVDSYELYKTPNEGQLNTIALGSDKLLIVTSLTGDGSFTYDVDTNALTIIDSDLIVTFLTKYDKDLVVNGYTISGLGSGDSVKFNNKLGEGFILTSGNDNNEFIVEKDGMDNDKSVLNQNFLLNKDDTLSLGKIKLAYDGVITLGANTDEGSHPVPIKICGEQQYFYGTMVNMANDITLSEAEIKNINGPRLSSNTNFKFSLGSQDSIDSYDCIINSCDYEGYKDSTGALVAWCGDDYPKFEVVLTRELNLEYSNLEWASDSTGEVKLYPFDENNFLQVDSFESYKNGVLTDDSFYVGDDTNGYKILPKDKQVSLEKVNFKMTLKDGATIIKNFELESGQKEKIVLVENNEYRLRFDSNNKLELIDCSKFSDGSGEKKKEDWDYESYCCNPGQGIVERFVLRDSVKYSPAEACSSKGVSNTPISGDSPVATTLSPEGTTDADASEAKQGAASGSCAEKKDYAGKAYSCQCGMRAYDPSGAIIAKSSTAGMWTKDECDTDDECDVGLCNGNDKYYYCCSDATANNRNIDAKKGSDKMNEVISAWNAKKEVPGAVSKIVKEGNICLEEGTLACLDDGSVASCEENLNYRSPLTDSSPLYWVVDYNCAEGVCNSELCNPSVSVLGDPSKCCKEVTCDDFYDCWSVLGIDYSCDLNLGVCAPLSELQNVDGYKGKLVQMSSNGLNACYQEGESLYPAWYNQDSGRWEISWDEKCKSNQCWADDSNVQCLEEKELVKSDSCSTSDLDGTFELSSDKYFACYTDDEGVHPATCSKNSLSNSNEWDISSVCPEDSKCVITNIVECIPDFEYKCNRDKVYQYDYENYEWDWAQNCISPYSCDETACNNARTSNDCCVVLNEDSNSYNCGLEQGDYSVDMLSSNNKYACLVKDKTYYTASCDITTDNWKTLITCKSSEDCLVDNTRGAYCTPKATTATEDEVDEYFDTYSSYYLEQGDTCKAGTFACEDENTLLACPYGTGWADYGQDMKSICGESGYYCNPASCGKYIKGSQPSDCCINSDGIAEALRQTYRAPSTSTWSLFKANVDKAKDFFLF